MDRGKAIQHINSYIFFSAIIFYSLFCRGTLVFSDEKGNDPIPDLAYSVMYDSVIQIPKVDELITLCSRKTIEFTCKLPSHKNALGVLNAVEFPLSMGVLAESIISPKKEQIFISSCKFYHNDLSLNSRSEFLTKPEGTVRFIGHYQVNGRYFTSFTYDIQAEWVKSNGWLMERGFTLPGIKQIKGIAGYINDIHSFTLIAPLESNRTLRISASWDDIGGKLPVVGKIHASYQDIVEAIRKGNDDIREYFKIQNENVLSKTNNDAICN